MHSGSKRGHIKTARRAWGLTLIELMVTMAVAGILLGLAVPNFRGFLTNSRANALTNDLVTAFYLARSEAVKRGVQVTVCKSTNTNDTNPTCSTSAGWETGWLIFTDGGTRGTLDGSDTLLRVRQPTSSSGTIEGDANFRNYVTYLPGGQSLGGAGGSGAGTLTICVGDVGRSIEIMNIGRVRTAQGTCP